MNLCHSLWSSYNALKQEYVELERFLKEENKITLFQFQEAIKKLTILKEEFNASLYTKLPDGKEIYTLDYISLIRICEANELDFLSVLERQDNESLSHNDHFLNQDKRINSLKLGNLNLKSLDVSTFNALTELRCSHNQLEILDVSNNPKLIELHCTNNLLTHLNTSQNFSLKQLSCSCNLITTLDISKNTELRWLGCSENQLSYLDVSENTSLSELLCANNKLTKLDVSNNSNLTAVYCRDNRIISLLSLLDLQNLISVDAASNPLDEVSIQLAKIRRWKI